MKRAERRSFTRLNGSAAIANGALIAGAVRVPLPQIRHVAVIRATRPSLGHLRTLAAVLAAALLLTGFAPWWLSVVAAAPLGWLGVRSARDFLAGPDHAVAVLGRKCRLLLSQPDQESAALFVSRLREAIRSERGVRRPPPR